MNRLTSASFGMSNIGQTNLNTYNEMGTVMYGYNANSSLTSMTRYGKKDVGFGVIDNLTYSYNGNQLNDIYDAVSDQHYDGAFEFKNNAVSLPLGAPEYGYDGCGSMTHDLNRGIAKIDYDLLGNPKRVQFFNGNVTEYVYSADGRRLKTTHRTAVSGIDVSLGQVHTLTASETMSKDSTVYYGDFIYDNNVFKQYNFADGYSSGVGSARYYHYYIRDHQGNNRVVATYNGTIEQTNHYYPYGGILSQSTNQGVQKYKYNEKELERMHGLDLYDYGARQQDPTIGMFTSMDPLCEKYYHISPYVHCAGNPIRYVDPYGEYIAMYDCGVQYRYNIEKESFIDNEGNIYNGYSEFIKTVTFCLKDLCRGEAGKTLVHDLATRIEGVGIIFNNISGEHERYYYKEDDIKSVIQFNPNQEVHGVTGTPILAHEMGHSLDRLNGTMLNDVWFHGYSENVTISERYAMHWENMIRAEHNLTLRQYYDIENSQGACYQFFKDKCISLYFDCKYPNNVNYRNKLI